jgi:hypothetical protein
VCACAGCGGEEEVETLGPENHPKPELSLDIALIGKPVCFLQGIWRSAFILFLEQIKTIIIIIVMEEARECASA